MWPRVTALLLTLLAQAVPAVAQSFEVTPFAGYRFGGDFFELVTRQRLDTDGAPAFGVAVDVNVSPDYQVEALYTHQSAHGLVPVSFVTAPVPWDVNVDHWLVGGLKEFDDGRARPFLTGALGLTNYSTEGDSEVRFAVAAGGGAKLFPSEHLGIRLHSQVYATFVDANASVLACGPGLCFLGFNANVVWQIEFTAGLILRFR
jgi:hypothetical protein